MLGLNLIGDVQVDTGIGEATRFTLLAIQRQNIPLSFSELNYNWQGRVIKNPDPALLSFPPGNHYPVNLLAFNMEQTASLAPEAIHALTQNKYTIGSWAYELPNVPDRFLPALDYVHEIWIPSQFCRDIFQRVTQLPVTVMPYPIELAPVENSDPAKFNIDGKRYVFLFSFAASSSDARKNPWGVLRAFEQAFGKSEKDGPLLVIKAHHIDLFPNLYRDLSTAVEEVGGILLEQTYSRQEVNELMACCDAFVSLHRAEGFGLGMAEAMYLGKPTLGTNYSGNVDFMTQANSYPISYQLKYIERDDFRYNKDMIDTYTLGQQWAEPNIDEAAQIMRRLYEHPDEGRQRGSYAAQDIRRRFSPEAIGEKIADRLTTITASLLR